MRSRWGKAALIAVVRVASTAFPGWAFAASTAATPSPAPTAGTAYRDYLATPTSGANSATVETVGAAECGKQISARQGNWACFETAGKTASSAPSGASAAAAATSYCTNGGCYQRYDDFHADYQSTQLTWGYGSQPLGIESHYVNIQLTGASAQAKAVTYRNSSATSNVFFTGDLINAAPGAVGTSVSGSFSLYSAGAVAANTSKSWSPNGYKIYDNTQFDHSVVNQFSWEKTGYEGYWYVYVKSISAHTNVRNSTSALYRFRSPISTSLPATPYSSGFNTG